MDWQDRPFGLCGGDARRAWCTVVRGGIRLAVAVASATAALALLVPAAALPARAGSQQALSSLEHGVVDQINDIRVAHGLAPLVPNASLGAAAAAHCAQMVADGYFGHQTATGLSFAERLEYWYPVGRSSFYTVGENLYSTSTSTDGSGVVGQWMLSPPHRANILSAAWRQIGVAAVTVPSAPGVYDGLAVTVVTADFGARR